MGGRSCGSKAMESGINPSNPSSCFTFCGSKVGALGAINPPFGLHPTTIENFCTYLFPFGLHSTTIENFCTYLLYLPFYTVLQKYKV